MSCAVAPTNKKHATTTIIRYHLLLLGRQLANFESLDRIRRSAPVIEPKTTPDDELKVFGALRNTAGQRKRIDEARNATGAS
jgi:hypothetical protein